MNNELKCPNCGTVFQIDEQDYESIVKQIRDKEFEREINVREQQYKNDKEQALKKLELIKNENWTYIKWANDVKTLLN